MKSSASVGTTARRRLRRSAGVVITVPALVFGAINVATTASALNRPSGPVDVLYAGSLFNVMQRDIGPAFHRATGYSVVGIANGSSALASEIKGGTEVGDVFISASPSADRSLQGAPNGRWVTTYQEFATSPLELAFNPASRFAHALRTSPWYGVVTRQNFLLGRTDPATDPKGVLAVEALDVTAHRLHDARLAALATSKSNVFEETALVGELDAGQLDAGFFYAVEAKAAKLTTVPLTGVTLFGEYTVAELSHAPHARAARAFITFLESRVGQRILTANGLTPFAKVRSAPVAP